MKKIISAVLVILVVLCMLLPTGCGSNKEKVLIYASSEEYRLEDLRARLKEEFPQYNCVVEYKDTGSHAATLMAEGKDTPCDISYELEYGYMTQLADEGLLLDLSDYDFSKYLEDTVISSYFTPSLRNGGAIIVNPEVLAEKGLSKPTCYEDLLKPEYKGLISMPNPKSSGTGYMFLKALVNAMGEQEAFQYFDKLSENILAFTSSGSGPVNALKTKEAAIGLGMTAQTVTAINEGANLEIIFFEEGSPFSLYGQAIIKGKESRQCVKEVFDFLVNTYTEETNKKFFPEQIFKDKVFEVENYPSNIKYADMSNDTMEEKTRLLDQWKH